MENKKFNDLKLCLMDAESLYDQLTSIEDSIVLHCKSFIKSSKDLDLDCLYQPSDGFVLLFPMKDDPYGVNVPVTSFMELVKENNYKKVSIEQVRSYGSI